MGVQRQIVQRVGGRHDHLLRCLASGLFHSGGGAVGEVRLCGLDAGVPRHARVAYIPDSPTQGRARGRLWVGTRMCDVGYAPTGSHSAPLRVRTPAPAPTPVLRLLVDLHEALFAADRQGVVRPHGHEAQLVGHLVGLQALRPLFEVLMLRAHVCVAHHLGGGGGGGGGGPRALAGTDPLHTEQQPRETIQTAVRAHQTPVCWGR